MPAPSRTPWSFDKSWGDPLIATLLLLSLLLGSQVLARRLAPAPPSDRVSLAGRLGEASLLAPQHLRFQGRAYLNPTDWAQAKTRLREPWDQAVVAILAADQGDRTPAAETPEIVRKALRFAYEGGEPLSAQERAQVLKGLASTYAGRVLEARFLDREGGDGTPIRATALKTLRQRVLTLAALGLLLAAFGMTGAGFALRLFILRRRPFPALAAWDLGGRVTALVLLAWFSALLFSGTLGGLLVFPLPAGWKILGLPLAYGAHAAFGLFLLRGFSGTDFQGWRDRLFTLPWRQVMGWSGGFAGLAVAAVFLAGLVFAPLLRHAPPAQKELLETLATARSVPATLLIFLTVAVLAPVFEELLFRGFLLPWLAARWGRNWALLASTLLFGAIHLAPSGLPALSALGLVLGLAYLRTGDLRVCILVHGAWNGSVFLFTRWVLG